MQHQAGTSTQYCSVELNKVHTANIKGNHPGVLSWTPKWQGPHLPLALEVQLCVQGLALLSYSPAAAPLQDPGPAPRGQDIHSPSEIQQNPWGGGSWKQEPAREHPGLQVQADPHIPSHMGCFMAAGKSQGRDPDA